MRRRYKVHDPEHTAHVGDQVRFVECRPISKEKRWRLVDVIGHASAPASAELVA